MEGGAILFEVLAWCMVFATSADDSQWALLVSRIWLSIDVLRLDFKILVGVLALSWSDGNAARTHTEEAARGLVSLRADKIGVEGIASSLVVLAIFLIVLMLVINSGPRRRCNGIFSLR